MGAPLSLPAWYFYLNSHLLFFILWWAMCYHPRHLKFLKLCECDLTFYCRSKLSKVGQSRGSLWWLLPIFGQEIAPSQSMCQWQYRCWNPPGWLYSAWRWTEGTQTNTSEVCRHLRWPGWQVALQQVNGSLLRAHRDKMCCVSVRWFWDGPQWGRQLWLLQGHGAIMCFLKDFCGVLT